MILVCERSGEPVRKGFIILSDEPLLFTGLDPETSYTIRISDTRNGLAGSRTGVRLSDGEVTVGLRRGGVIRGRLEGRKGGTGQNVWGESAGLSVWCDVAEDGAFELIGLPPGLWKLSSWKSGDSYRNSWEATVEVPEGGTVDVVIQPKR